MSKCLSASLVLWLVVAACVGPYGVEAYFECPGSCSASSAGATDRGDRGCEWFDERSIRSCSSSWDDDDFTADDMCCSCGGGSTGSCADVDPDAVSKGGYVCDDWIGSEEDCSSTEWDDDDFTVTTNCCVCGGGHSGMCTDMDHGAVSKEGYTCEDWYGSEEDCSSTEWDDDDFTLSTMCCACGGGSQPGSGSCSDIDPDAVSKKGYMCDDWVGYEEDCSSSEFDDDDFTALTMCCVCGGGNKGCTATSNGATNRAGHDCDWYEKQSFGTCGTSRDDDDFTAEDMCCACGGGQGAQFCTHSNGDATDKEGNTCDYYSDGLGCGLHDDDDFHADDMCCGCGGGNGGSGSCEDTIGDAVSKKGYTCDDWVGFEEDCSSTEWDDDDFTLSTMCCACGGGDRSGCKSTSNGATDLANNGCVWYEHNHFHSCGTSGDDDDFSADDMCCGCGGGSGPHVCLHSNGDILDKCGDGCEWYDDGLGCGDYDTFDFSAKVMCCGCGGGSGCPVTCICPHGTLDENAMCFSEADEVCASCNAGWTLSGSHCIENVCVCDFGVPATGAACHADGAHVCVSCVEAGFELIPSEGKATGTCVAVVQELCDCANGVAAQGAECVMSEDVVVGRPTVDSWEPSDSFSDCQGSSFQRNAPHADAITMQKGACPAEDAVAVNAVADIPDGAKEVSINFKYTQVCALDCAPLAVGLTDSDDASNSFFWCVAADASLEQCDYTFPKEEVQGAEHTLVFHFDKFFQKHGKHPTKPQLVLSVVGKAQSQSTQILKVEFLAKHDFKPKEDDVCISCDDGFNLIRHEGRATGYCQACCTCTGGTPAVGDECTAPGEVCTACLEGYQLEMQTCQPKEPAPDANPAAKEITGNIALGIEDPETWDEEATKTLFEYALTYLCDIDSGLVSVFLNGNERPVTGENVDLSYVVKTKADVDCDLSGFEAHDAMDQLTDALKKSKGSHNLGFEVLAFSKPKVSGPVGGGPGGGSLESMPAGQVAAMPSVAADSIGVSDLPAELPPRIGAFVAVSAVASLVAVGLLICARAWKSKRYSYADLKLLPEAPKEAEDAA